MDSEFVVLLEVFDDKLLLVFVFLVLTSSLVLFVSIVIPLELVVLLVTILSVTDIVGLLAKEKNNKM